MSVRLTTVDRFNWEQVAQLSVSEEQTKFIPSNLYTIAQSKYENLDLYALYLDDIPVGLGAIGFFAKVYWISRIMIDYRYQKLGYGSELLRLLLGIIQHDRKSYEVRTSVLSKNITALNLFKKHGFQVLGEMSDGEIILHKWLNR
jgi:diamine N-acetyltransferase